MDTDLIRQVNQVQQRVEGLVLPETSIDLISPFLALPGLVGFWPMSSVQRSTGNAYDLSGQGRTLTYNGNPTYNYYNNFVPYIALDGTGDYLSRADETDLDILGTEAIIGAGKGLTIGGWFNFSVATPATLYGLMGKIGSATTESYILYRPSSTSTLAFAVNNTGLTANRITCFSTVTPNVSTWYFVVGKYVPSTSLTIFINGTPFTLTTSIPASIFNSTSALEIGRTLSGNNFNGYVSLCFLSTMSLSDNHIYALFQCTRGAFGV